MSHRPSGDRFALLVVLALAFGAAAGPSECAARQGIVYNGGVEKRFTAAITLFRNGTFGEAAAAFDELRRLKPPHQRTTASYLMLAKSWFALKNYQPSELLLLEFLERFPSSSYAGDALYSLGLDHLMMGRFEEAGGEFLHCLERTPAGPLARRSETLFEYVADERLTAPGLERLNGLSFQGAAKDLLRLKLAEKYRDGGEAARAKEILYSLGSGQKGNPYRQRARELLDETERQSGVRIGVVLPLMEGEAANPVKNLAGDLLAGVTFAVKEQASHPRSRTPVSIEVKDSKRDTAGAALAVRSAAASPDVIGIIGPVFSDEVAASARAANSAGVPMISPTATANALAGSGSHVFQLHADWSTRGRAMARYAVSYLGFSALAVLSSADAPESLAAASFADEARRLGARVAAFEIFPAGASDLHEQFLRIRRGAAGLGRDSLPPGRGGADTVSDNTDIAVTSIQGIFVAVDNSEEIGVVASQLSYFNIRTQILGNEEWYDPPQLDVHKQYVEGAVFTSDYFTDPADSAFARFDRQFAAATGRHPSKYAVIGYDTMTLLLDRIAGGATTRAALTAALRAVERSPALHTNVTLRNGGANSEVQILKYINGEVRKVIELQVN